MQRFYRNFNHVHRNTKDGISAAGRETGIKKSTWTFKGFAGYLMIVFCLIGIFFHLEMILGERWILFEIPEVCPNVSLAIVKSGSMSPVLEVDDLVLIAESADYQPGDIVKIVGAHQTPILHRLIIYNAFADIALTRGDANETVDEPIRCSDIQGKLLLRIPCVGTVLDFFQTNPLQCLATFFSLLIFLSTLWTVVKEKRYQRGKVLTEQPTLLKTEKNGKGWEGLRNKKHCLGMIGLVILMLLTIFIFSVSRISALWRSGATGSFSIQAGSAEEQDLPELTEGIDEVYLWLD